MKQCCRASVEIWNGWKIVQIEGRFTSESLLAVKEVLEGLDRSKQERIAIDLSKSVFVDAIAIQIMINFKRRIDERGGHLKILSPSHDVLDILKTLCVNDLLESTLSRESFERIH